LTQVKNIAVCILALCYTPNSNQIVPKFFETAYCAKHYTNATKIK